MYEHEPRSMHFAHYTECATGAKSVADLNEQSERLSELYMYLLYSANILSCMTYALFFHIIFQLKTYEKKMIDTKTAF